MLCPQSCFLTSPVISRVAVILVSRDLCVLKKKTLSLQVISMSRVLAHLVKTNPEYILKHIS